MHLASVLAKYGVIIEFMLIIFFILSTYFLKAFYFLKARNKKLLLTQLELFLQKNISANTQIAHQDFNNHWKKIGILLMIVRKFDGNLIGGNWPKIRMNFIRIIILPLAREAALSNDWTMRHYAAEAFMLYSENGDEDYILRLLNDKVPLVSYSAANAAIIYGSEKALNLIITQMAKESWLTQSLYVQAFDRAPFSTHYYLERRIKDSSDVAIKSTCYNILLKYPPFKVEWDINVDIESKHLILRLAAIRFIAHNQKELAVPILLNLLSDPDWQIKTVVLGCLTHLKIISMVPEVSLCLEDANWWVRLAAAQVLKDLGASGEQALKLKNLATNPIPIDAAQHVLFTF